MARPPERKSVAEAIEALAKKQGGAYIVRGDRLQGLGVAPRIELGIFSLDYLMGGGVPWGMLTLVYGAESGGKTLFAIKTVAAAGRMCRRCVCMMEPTGEEWLWCSVCGSVGDEEKCGCGTARTFKVPRLACPKCKKWDPVKTLYVDQEKTFDMAWAVAHGVNRSLMYFVQAETGGQANDAIMGMLETGEFGLIVIDSLAQMVPKAEIEELTDKALQAPQARLVNKCLRMLVSQQNKCGPGDLASQVTFVVTNQLRSKLGVYFGNPDIKPAGKGQDFAASVILKLRTSKYEKDLDKNTVRVLVSVGVDKSKISPTTKMNGKFVMWLRGCDVDGIPRPLGDTEEDVVLTEYGLNYGIIKKAGAKYDVAGASFTSVDKVREHLRTDWRAMKAVRTALLPELLGEVWHSIKERETAKKEGERD